MREALLTILTLGDQYGLQIKNELLRRTDGALNVNSGQVYQTLDRLVRDGLVQKILQTDDGLPLYSVTVAGRAVAEAWIHKPAVTGKTKNPWETMVMQVLVVRSLGSEVILSLLQGYKEFWLTVISDIHGSYVMGMTEITEFANTSSLAEPPKFSEYADSKENSGSKENTDSVGLAILPEFSNESGGGVSPFDLSNIIRARAAVEWLDLMRAADTSLMPLLKSRPQRGRPKL